MNYSGLFERVGSGVVVLVLKDFGFCFMLVITGGTMLGKTPVRRGTPGLTALRTLFLNIIFLCAVCFLNKLESWYLPIIRFSLVNFIFYFQVAD